MVNDNEMKPEEEVEIILWDWLKPTKYNNIKEIYFNRINKINAPTFQTKGLNKKPDFIILLNRGFGNEYMVVEIKDASKTINILKGTKILDYYKNYISNKTKYYINENEIKIHHFSIATQQSKNGTLFFEDNELIENDKKDLVKMGILSNKEYRRNKDYIRGLFNGFKELRKEFNLKDIKSSSLGILISNPGTKENYPYYQTVIYVDWIKRNNIKWGQRFLKL